VANNCSDNTVKIAKELADVVINTPTPGISRAKNLGAERAKGETYCFLDADSLMEQDLLYLAAKRVKDGFDLCKAKIMPLDDQSFGAKFSCYTGNLVNSFTENLTFTDGGNGAFTFVTPDTFYSISGFNENASVMIDVDFFVRAKSAGAKMNFITKKGVYTSMRRFMQRGYLACTFEDMMNNLNHSLVSRSWNY